MKTPTLSPPLASHRGPRPLVVSALVGLVLLLLATPLAAGASVPASAPSLVTPPWSAWAYSGYQVVTGSGSVSAPGGTTFDFTFHGAYGEAVVIGQTNTSASTYMLQGTQTIGSLYYVTLCEPSCSNPRGEGNITLSSWQQDQAFANLTESGSVNVNGTATPALALENDHSISAGNVTRLMQWTYAGGSGFFGRGGSGSNGFSYASAQMSANTQVAFTPSLGLQPLNTTPGEAWQSSAGFAGSASLSAAFYLYSTRGQDLSGQPSGTLNLNGNLTLNGGDQGRIPLGRGILAHAFGYRFNAPFQLWDGLFLLPMGAAPMLGSGQAWEQGGDLGVSGQPSTVDFAPGQGHAGWIASSSSFAADQIGMPSGAPPSGGSWSLGMASPSAGLGASLSSATSNANLQTEPSSVSSAQALAGSLVVSPAFSKLAPLPGGRFGPGLIVIVAAIAVGVVVALLLVRRRRSGKATRSPSSPAFSGYHLEADEPEEEWAGGSSGRPSASKPASEPDPFRDLM